MALARGSASVASGSNCAAYRSDSAPSMRKASARHAAPSTVASAFVSTRQSGHQRACVRHIAGDQAAVAGAVVAQHKGVAVAACGGGEGRRTRRVSTSQRLSRQAKQRRTVSSGSARSGGGRRPRSWPERRARRDDAKPSSASALCSQPALQLRSATRQGGAHLQSQRHHGAVLRRRGVERERSLQRSAAAHPRAGAAAGCLVCHDAASRRRTARRARDAGPGGAGVGSGPAEVRARLLTWHRAAHLHAHYRRHGTLACAAAVRRARGVRGGAHRRGGGGRCSCGCSAGVRQAASEGAAGHLGGAWGGVQGLQRESRPGCKSGGGLALAGQGASRLLARAAAQRLHGALSGVASSAVTRSRLRRGAAAARGADSRPGLVCRACAGRA